MRDGDGATVGAFPETSGARAGLVRLCDAGAVRCRLTETKICGKAFRSLNTSRNSLDEITEKTRGEANRGADSF